MCRPVKGEGDGLRHVLVALQARKERQGHPHTVVVAALKDGSIEGESTVVLGVGDCVQHGLDRHDWPLHIAAQVFGLPLRHVLRHLEQRPAIEKAVG